MKLSWLNWGRQMRMAPSQNIHAPQVKAVRDAALKVLGAAVGGWWRSASPTDRFLLGGIKLGCEASLSDNSVTSPASYRESARGCGWFASRPPPPGCGSLPLSPSLLTVRSSDDVIAFGRLPLDGRRGSTRMQTQSTTQTQPTPQMIPATASTIRSPRTRLPTGCSR